MTNEPHAPLKFLGKIDVIGDTHAHCTLQSGAGDQWLASIPLVRFNGMTITVGDYFDVSMTERCGGVAIEVSPAVRNNLTAEEMADVQKMIDAVYGDISQ